MAFNPNNIVSGVKDTVPDITPLRRFNPLTVPLTVPSPRKTTPKPEPVIDTIPEEVVEKSGGEALPAFVHGAARSGTLGLAHKLLPPVMSYFKHGPLAGEAGVDLEKRLLAEREAEVKEASPFASRLGEFTGFIAPGSLTKKAVKGIGGKLLSTAAPGFKGALTRALGAGLGFGGAEAIRGTVEEGPKEGLKRGLVTAPLAGALNVGLEGTSKLLAPVGKKAVTALTGKPYEALKQYAVRPKAVQAASEKAGGPQAAGEKLVEMLQSSETTYPQYQAAIKDLTAPTKGKWAPEVNIAPVVEKMQGMVNKGARRPGEELAVSKVMKFLDQYMPKTVTGANKVSLPASEAEALKQIFQQEAKGAYGYEGSPEYQQLMKELGAMTRNQIQSFAKREGKTVYIKNMADISKKLNVVKGLKKFIGREVDIQPERAAQKLSRTFEKGAHNKIFLKRLKEFDKEFGTNFEDDALLMKSAADLSPSGQPPLIRAGIAPLSTVGSGIGAMYTGRPEMLAGLLAPYALSPRMASLAISGLGPMVADALKVGPITEAREAGLLSPEAIKRIPDYLEYLKGGEQK